jgi:hypothetical protein
MIADEQGTGETVEQMKTGVQATVSMKLSPTPKKIIFPYGKNPATVKFWNILTAAVKYIYLRQFNFSRNLCAAEKYSSHREKYFPIRISNFLFGKILSYWDKSFGHRRREPTTSRFLVQHVLH